MLETYLRLNQQFEGSGPYVVEERLLSKTVASISDKRFMQ